MNERRKVLEALEGEGGGKGAGKGKEPEGGEKLRALSARFGRAHGISSALNLVGVVAVGVVGWGIGSRLC